MCAKKQDRRIAYKRNQLTSCSLTTLCCDLTGFRIELFRAWREDLQKQTNKNKKPRNRGVFLFICLFLQEVIVMTSVDGLLPFKVVLIPLPFWDKTQVYFLTVGVCKDLLSVFTVADMLNPGFWSSSNLRSYFLLSFCSRFVLAAISSSTCCHTFSCLLSSFKQPPHSPSVCVSNYFWSGTWQHNITLQLRGDMIML